jgi:hypothetical protein
VIDVRNELLAFIRVSPAGEQSSILQKTDSAGSPVGRYRQSSMSDFTEKSEKSAQLPHSNNSGIFGPKLFRAQK